MSAPAPGSIPIVAPMVLLRNNGPRRRAVRDRTPGSSPAGPCDSADVDFVRVKGSARSPRRISSTLRRTSDRPNKPIIAGMKLIPVISSSTPNVKRGAL